MSGEAGAGAPRLLRTPFHAQHVAAGARMVDFGGWDMPVQYPTGIIAEHLATRGGAGLFDVSHMGRFVLRGPGSAAFLQHVLSNNAEALDLLQAQYTMVPTETGGAVDDAYLYRFTAGEYLLVVNASNRHKDWDHFRERLSRFPDVEMSDETGEIAMVALQGKTSREILGGLLERGRLPEPLRNELSLATLRMPGDGRLVEARIARTGYTGEPVAFEVFTSAHDGPAVWDALTGAGAVPVGLGARDTLRLEAGLPLYGHELGVDPEGCEIPIFSCPLATFAVSFSPLKDDFIGRHALERQQKAYARILQRDYSLLDDLPRLTRPVAVTGRGIAREGAAVHAAPADERFGSDALLGWVTSGTAVPYWGLEGEGLCSLQTEEHELRSIALASLDSRVLEDDEVGVDVRGRRVPGLVVPHHLRSDAPPCARAIIWDDTPQLSELEGGEAGEKALRLLGKAIANHEWRQQECIDLIPSEMTPSPMTRLLSITDPSGRYAEHKKAEAFYDADVFYYQGTGFIHEVERLLVAEFRAYLGCPEVETRTVSGQMANTAVFSALVDYLNRADRKAEPRRIAKVVNNHIAKGGHLSAQPMGALRDYVARDPRTELPAVVDIPVLPDNPYKADVGALLDVIEEQRPELVILGKSMVLHPEPVYEVRQFLDAAGIPAVLMYDMAHVLGLAGPHFQEPFVEGADIVTGSTHKTFFGTQRGDRGRPLGQDRREVRPLGGDRAAHLPRLGEQPPPGDAARPAHGGLRDEPLQGRLAAGRDRQRQGLRRGAPRRRARRRRRPGGAVHRDAPGRTAGRLRTGPGGRRPAGGQRHHRQLPGGARRRGLHRRRRASARGRGDDALRHGSAAVRRGRGADGRGHPRGSRGRGRGAQAPGALHRDGLLLQGAGVRTAGAAAARADLTAAHGGRPAPRRRA